MVQKFFHRTNGNFRSLLIREMEFACGNTAERDALQVVCGCQLQTGVVAGGQIRAILSGYTPLNDRAYGVEYISCRQVIASRQFCAAIRLRVSLRQHQSVAFIPELKPCRRVDGIVNTAVAGNKAPQQGRIICVYNGVCPQPGDVPLPNCQPRIA